MGKLSVGGRCVRVEHMEEERTGEEQRAWIHGSSVLCSAILPTCKQVVWYYFTLNVLSRSVPVRHTHTHTAMSYYICEF